MSELLLTGGRIHSPLSPDATAMAVTNGEISWVGKDAPASTLFPDAPHRDLAGTWVTPAFAEVCGGGVDPKAAAKCGVILASTPEVPTKVASLEDRTPEQWVDELVRDGVRVLATASAAGAMMTSESLRSVPRIDDDIVRWTQALQYARSSHGTTKMAASAPMLIGLPAAATTRSRSEQDENLIDALGTLGVIVVVTAGDEPGDLRRLARAGVTVTASTLFGSTLDPWSMVRTLSHPERHISALSPRAALTALTRSAWRAAGFRDGMQGTLVPGAPAMYAEWSAAELVLTAPADAVQRWSTDPRSGVPGMPELSSELPQLTRLSTPDSYIADEEKIRQ